MNGSKQMIQGALRMKNLMRPGPTEARAALGGTVPPPLAQSRPVQAAPPPAPLAVSTLSPEGPPPRRSVYMDLMKKHDALNPRIKL